MIIEISLSIPTPHGSSPHERVVQSLEMLTEVVKHATPETPALGGALRDKSGAVIGSYIVEFK